jgi:hypothetical protein
LKGHNGIDFAVVTGTKVYACDPGIVSVVRADSGGYGTHVRVDHDWGQSIYGHFSKPLVSVGQAIQAGDCIGLSGNTGNSTGPHLHFEIRPDYISPSNGYAGAIDPLPLLQQAGFSPGNIPTPEPPLVLILGQVTADLLNVRTGPGINYPVIGQVKKNEFINIVGLVGREIWLMLDNGYYCAAHHNGYVYVKLLKP